MSGKKEQEKIYNLKLENLEKLFDFKISEIYKIDAEKDRAMELRLHGMNELRKVVEDQAATFFTRREHELYMDKQTSDALRLREKVEADAKSIREKVEADAKSMRKIALKLMCQASTLDIFILTLTIHPPKMAKI